MAIPTSPVVPDRPAWKNVSPILGTPVQLTGNVTLTTPTSATLITGLTIPVTVPASAAGLFVMIQGQNATVSAGATITLGLYEGATAGALTTLIATQVVVAPTGGTTVAITPSFFIPGVTTGSYSTNLSIAATASTGNFVLNASATAPTNMVVLCF